MYNNNESAQEDNQKTNQKPTPQENGDSFDCKVEGKRPPTHTRINMRMNLKASVDVGQFCFEGT